jgi:hypothetical protein
MRTRHDLRMRRLIPLASLALIFALGVPAMAQRAPGPKPPADAGEPKSRTVVKAKPKTQAQAPVPTPQPQVAMPDAEKIVLLVRTTLLTLNDALRTGNYTVLRDKGAPGFRDANSAARLGQIFASLAATGVDLSVVSVMTPQLSEAPLLDQARGTLNLKGYFPTTPTQIDFEVLYQSVNGHWQVFGLSVQPVKAAQAPQVGSAQDGTVGGAKPQ